MLKKVRDILPPEKTREKKAVIATEEARPRFKIFASQKSFLPFKKSLVFVSFFLILAGVFGYFIFPGLWGRAEIEIWPETKNLYLETELTIDKEAKESSVLAKIIPGQILEKEKFLIETFLSSGKALKEAKAEGIIRVYNEYSASSQILVASTRFVSSDGKVFRTPVSVTVPGRTYQGAKFIPGQIDVKVVADQPGPEYNIGSATFSIPGFAGTDRYTKFYAKSFQAMAGGFSQEVAKATKEDIVKAEESLAEKAKKECQDLLNNELLSEDLFSRFYYFLEENQSEIVEKFSLAKPEEETKEFQVQIRTKCKILLFEKENLNDFAKELTSNQIPEKDKLYQESLKIDFSSKTADFDSGKMTVFLKIGAKSYPEIDFYAIKNALTGKSLPETKVFLENQAKIIKVNVEFWPFWARKAPTDLDQIRIEIMVD